MFNFSNYKELGDLVEGNAGVLTIKMEQLRDIHGAGKLGVHVRAGISDNLRQQGLGHFPPELPNYQWDEVRVYKQGTPVGRLIEAVLAVSEDNDEVIREMAGSDASATLVKIRELVCT
jgi:hypothetical protein